MKTKLLFFFSLILSCMFIVSCNRSDKNQTENKDPGVNSELSIELVSDDILADEIIEDIIEEADEVTSMEYESDLKTITSTVKSVKTEDETDLRKCRQRTVTYYGDGSRKIEIEYFGECRDNQTRIREGKIIIMITGKWWSSDFSRTITFENYTINGNMIEGSKTIKNINDSEQEEDALVLTNMTSELTYDIKITKENGNIIEKEGKRIRSLIGGTEGKWFFWDYKFQVEGYSNNYKKIIDGDEISEYNIRMDITKPLIKLVVWPFYVEGTKQLVVNSLDTVIVDYGDGEMDAIVTVTTADTTIVKNLHGVCWGKRH